MQHLSMMNVEKYLRVRTHLHVARQRRVPLRMRSELRLRGSKRTHYRRCGATDSGVIALSIGAINICGVGNRKKKKTKNKTMLVIKSRDVCTNALGGKNAKFNCGNV